MLSRVNSLTDRLGDIKPQNKLVIAQGAPSIPYRDTSHGYEPIDQSGKHLISVGGSFKHNYLKYYDKTPGPGAYDIAKDYLKHKNSVKLISYNKDTSQRSDINIKSAANLIGPGQYNIEQKKSKVP